MPRNCGRKADNPQLGGYTVREAIEHTVTLRTALEERLGKDRVLFSRGCTTAGNTSDAVTVSVTVENTGSRRVGWKLR